jgi:hypothetical protein
MEGKSSETKVYQTILNNNNNNNNNNCPIGKFGIAAR